MAHIDVIYLDDVPHDQFAYLRAHAPVFKQKVSDPTLVEEAWVLAKYADVLEVSRDTEHFTVSDTISLRRIRLPERKHLLNHLRRRRDRRAPCQGSDLSR